MSRWLDLSLSDNWGKILKFLSELRLFKQIQGFSNPNCFSTGYFKPHFFLWPTGWLILCLTDWWPTDWWPSDWLPRLLANQYNRACTVQEDIRSCSRHWLFSRFLPKIISSPYHYSAFVLFEIRRSIGQPTNPLAESLHHWTYNNTTLLMLVF